MNGEEQSAGHPTENLDPFATEDGQRQTGTKTKTKLPDFIGRYRVERLVGSGSFGAVYQALDERLNRRVAVKCPHAHLVRTSQDAEAYLNEARTVAILDHPHIVPVYDVGATDAIECYVVSKFIDGVDLAMWVRQNRPGIREVAELVLTLAEALHYAHRQGVVHRDIKPSNILIDTAGRPFVVDFGLALEEKNRGSGPEFAGTPAYMSPEQARGEGNRVDGRSDIFSLGVVLYELLCQRLPFQGKTRHELLEHIISWDPVPPRQIQDSVPKVLEQICLTAIAKRAGDRYSAARDLADDLRAFLSGDLSALPNRLPSPQPDIETASTQRATAEVERSTVEGQLSARLLPQDAVEEASGTKQKWIGEFQVIEKLGQGGMGAVYRAWHPMLRRQVALKVLLTVGNEKHEQRFAREIRALGPVRDEHLAEVFSSGSQDGIFYYAMELIEGTTLDAVCQELQNSGSAVDQLELSKWQAAVSTVCDSVRTTQVEDANNPAITNLPKLGSAPQKQVPLPKGRTYVEHIAELIRQVSSAAHKLHEVGAVHRDIKPGNIMVGLAGMKAVLIDLGLAQLADESDGKVTRTRQFVGTLRYASPEQVLAVARIDCRSDIYSLGATLWELLTLRAMFNAGDQTPTPELMSRIQYEEPQPVRHYNRSVPKDLEAIVMKCLEKNPQLRYASAQELADDLDRFLRKDPVTARPVGSIRKLGRRLQRVHRGTIVGALVALTLLATLGALQVRNFQRQAALRTIKLQINERMENLALDPAQGRATIDTIEQMQADFPEEATEQRKSFDARWRTLIESQMLNQAKIDQEDIARYQQCIELYGNPSTTRDELLNLLDKRLQRGSVLVDLRAPFSDISVVFPSKATIDESAKSIRLQPTSKYPYVKTRIANKNDTDVELAFTSQRWNDKEVGIELESGCQAMTTTSL